MAAALVPLIASIAPDLIGLITGLVHKQAPIAQANNGPSTGPVKFADVFTAVMTALQSAALAGSISKTLPSDDIVKVVIQSVVSSMKLSGLLDLQPVGNAAATQSLVLKAGQSVTITVQ